METIIKNVEEVLLKYFEENNIFNYLYESIDREKKGKKISEINIDSIKNLKINSKISDIYSLAIKLKAIENDLINDGYDLVMLKTNNKKINEILVANDTLNLFLLMSKKERLNEKDLKDIMFTVYEIKNKNKKPQYTSAEIDNNICLGELAYLDYGVIDKYEKYRDKLENIKYRNNIKFIYSPTHAEELIRREKTLSANKDSIYKYYSSLKETTNELIILPDPIFKKRVIGKEAISSVKKRIDYEELKIIDILTIIIYHKEYEEIHNYIKQKQLNIDINNMDSLDEIFEKYDILKNIFESKNITKQQNIEEVREQIKKDEIDYQYLDNIVFAILTFFNSIKYKTDLKNQKIISSYSDHCHIHMASNLKFLITEDSKLAIKAKAVYEYLGIKTEVINIKDYKIIL